MWHHRDKQCADVFQGTSAWDKLRAQCFNGSSCDKYITDNTKRSKDAAINAALVKCQSVNMYELPQSESFKNAEWGHEQEIFAKDWIFKYSKTGACDYFHAICDRDIETNLLVSPDLFHESGLFGIEVKCPTYQSGNHAYVINNVNNASDLKEYNKAYYFQIIASFIVFESAKKWFWCSYLGCMRDDYKLHVVEITRESVNGDIELLRKSLIEFRQIIKQKSQVKPNNNFNLC